MTTVIQDKELDDAIIIQNNALYKRVLVQINPTLYRLELIITKEQFIACYNEWVKEVK